METTEGVQYKYYEGRWEKLPDFINLSPIRVGVVNTFNLEGLEQRELYFGLVMHGFSQIKKDGVYTFFVSSNDGSKLLADNVEVVNNDGAHGTIEKSGKICFEKGMHLIEMRSFQAGGVKSLKVSWEGPGFEKREISEELLGY